MTQVYSNPERERDPHALPDAEVFHIPDDYQPEPGYGEPNYEPGWYRWSCFPGCLPDSDPVGPFGSEQEAILNAQEGS